MRIRAESTEVFAIGSLRPQLLVGQQHCCPAEGQVLRLRWRRLQNVLGPGRRRRAGWMVYAVCPRCGASVRLLRRAPGSEEWGCRSCLHLIYRSQRRSGNGNRLGGQKPAPSRARQWALHQERVATVLGLRPWPPRLLLWCITDLKPARRLSQARRDALLHRLEALEHLRLEALGSAGLMALAGGRHGFSSPELAHRVLRATAWAMRRNKA